MGGGIAKNQCIYPDEHFALGSTETNCPKQVSKPLDAVKYYSKTEMTKRNSWTRKLVGHYLQGKFSRLSWQLLFKELINQTQAFLERAG